MVFESVVVDVLNRFLGDYVVNLDTSQLSLGIWKGNEAAAAAVRLACRPGPRCLRRAVPSWGLGLLASPALPPAAVRLAVQVT